MPKKRAKAGTSRGNSALLRAKFIEAYCNVKTGGNATQAAIEAGYSPKTAYSQGQRLLKDVEVAAAVQRRRAEIIGAAQERASLSAQEVMDSLARDLRFDPARMLGENGEMLPLRDMPEDVRRALRGFEYDAKGRPKVRFPEQTAAREQAMKHFGLYEKDNNQKPPPLYMAVEFVRPAK